MHDSKPDPDILLARVQQEETHQDRGKLKIFFGATAGVGKTYAMLEAAHARRAEGVDVVVGWVDTHGRAETEALLQGKGNLIALRELALRRIADRVDAQMQVYRRDHAIAEIWPTTERILVCVSPSPLAARLVRATRRMATRLRAEWLVVYVETPAHLRLPAADRDRVVQTLRLADQLGAETVTLSGQSVSEELLTYARTRNVSKMVVGKLARPRWREIVVGSVVEELIKHSGDIDVYVINGDQGDSRPWLTPFRQRTSDWLPYVWGLGSVVLCTALAWLLFSHLTEANLIMLYLLGVAVVAMRCGRGPAIWASVLSVAAFDFFFVPPYLTFAVTDMAYLVTFSVMLFVALVISTLTIRLRQQADAARQRERRTASLYAMSRALASMRSVDDLLQAAARV